MDLLSPLTVNAVSKSSPCLLEGVIQTAKYPTDFQMKPKQEQCNHFHLNLKIASSERGRTAQTHFVDNIKQTLAEIDLELKQTLLKSIYYDHY